MSTVNSNKFKVMHSINSIKIKGQMINKIDQYKRYTTQASLLSLNGAFGSKRSLEETIWPIGKQKKKTKR